MEQTANNQEPLNSHVQITWAILRNFSNPETEYNERNLPVKRKMVYCLDLDQQAVKKEDIKDLDTEKGYYSREMEQFLNTYVEHPLGDLIKRARNFHKGKANSLTFDPNAIKNYVCFSLLRSQLVYQETNKPSAIKEILSLLGYDTKISHEAILKHPEALIGAFENFYANVFENDSNVEFVVPRNCVYYTHRREGNLMWVAPFSPRGAFVLIENAKELVEGGAFHTDDDEFIRQMNFRALRCEYKVNRRFVVSRRKDELEILQGRISELSNIP